MLGLRASEITLREVRDLDDEGQVLRVPNGKTRAARRNLIVPEVLRPMLLKLTEGKEARDPLFGTHRPAWVRNRTKAYCAKAGVPYVCAHGLRGTHTTLAADTGMAPEAVARSLGRSSRDLGP